MTPEGDGVAVEGIASAGLRPLGDHEQPLVRAERRPVDGIRSLSTEIAGVSDVMSS